MSILVVCQGCQAEYQLKEELAGRRVKCPKCQNVIDVPALQAGPEQGAPEQPVAGDRVFQRDKFLMRQKLVAISQKYYVWDEQGNTLLYVERPAHLGRNVGALLAGLAVFIIGFVLAGITATIFPADHSVLPVLIVVAILVTALVSAIAVCIWLMPKRHITIYRNDTKTERLLEILQDKKVALLNATYTVNDPHEGCLGRFRKNYVYNILRKRWYGYRPDGSALLVAKEDSLMLALLRRFIGRLFGALRTNFVILKPDAQLVGEFNRKFTLLDRYVLDLSEDRAGYLDRRLAVALGILLDTGESR